MRTKKLFLASSSELKEDRKDFEILIGRKNKDWNAQGVFIELIVWEDFFDAVSKTRLQDEYNKAIRECDIFVMLFYTKVGQYTEEEFETAFGQFKATAKPFIFTYFKDPEISIGSANKEDVKSLWAFQEKLGALGHFYTVYKNIDQLRFHFNQQLDKLATSGFIELKRDKVELATSEGNTYEANITGSGAIAQGDEATAVGERGVSVGGKNTGNINTGTQTNINTGGAAYVGGNVSARRDFIGRDQTTHGDQTTVGNITGSTGVPIGRGAQSTVTQGFSGADLEKLFAALIAAVEQHAPDHVKVAAAYQVQELKQEVSGVNRNVRFCSK